MLLPRVMKVRTHVPLRKRQYVSLRVRLRSLLLPVGMELRSPSRMAQRMVVAEVVCLMLFRRVPPQMMVTWVLGWRLMLRMESRQLMKSKVLPTSMDGGLLGWLLLSVNSLHFKPVSIEALTVGVVRLCRNVCQNAGRQGCQRPDTIDACHRACGVHSDDAAL